MHTTWTPFEDSSKQYHVHQSEIEHWNNYNNMYAMYKYKYIHKYCATTNYRVNINVWKCDNLNDLVWDKQFVSVCIHINCLHLKRIQCTRIWLKTTSVGTATYRHWMEFAINMIAYDASAPYQMIVWSEWHTKIHGLFAVAR